MDYARRFIARRGYVIPLVAFLFVLGILLDPERWIGGVAWTLLAAYGLYRFAVWMAGPYTLPIEPSYDAAAYARNVLGLFAGGQRPGMAVVREGKVLPDPAGKPRENVRGVGAILVDGTSVVALVTDTGLSRIEGPGVHFLREGEKLGPVIDLRPQLRSKEIEAQTQDGIWIKFRVAVRFQVDRTVPRKVQEIVPKQARYAEPYTWSQHAVKRLLGHTRIGADANQTERWDDRALNEAIKRAQIAVAGYTFDRLTEPGDPRLNPREDIRQRLEEELKADLVSEGLKLLGLRIGQFVPRDKEVMEQRIRSWQADWIRQMKIIEAESLAERFRLIETARAQGQMELVMRIVQALEASRQIGVENAEQVALRLLEVVEQLATEPEIEQRLTGEARAALDEAHVKLLKKGPSGGVAASS
ncbi:MAG TPA: SPFH domain-containing protein [Anaerolineae bacterium]|nr:SPFH domain-containing protein [Anaerolineae bacterium]